MLNIKVNGEITNRIISQTLKLRGLENRKQLCIQKVTLSITRTPDRTTMTDHTCLIRGPLPFTEAKGYKSSLF